MQKDNNPVNNLLAYKLTNVHQKYWQYYAGVICLLAIVIIINFFIYQFIDSSKEERKLAFIEGSELSIKNFIENDLKLIFDQSSNLNKLSILKNYSDVQKTDIQPNIVGSALYVNRGSKSLIFDLQPLMFLTNSILAQDFYYQIIVNGAVLISNIDDTKFLYIRSYQINKDTSLTIKLDIKNNSIFIQKYSEYFKNQIWILIIVSIIIFILIIPIIIYLINKENLLNKLNNKILSIEKLRDLNINYINACQDLEQKNILPIKLSCKKQSKQIEVVTIIEEIKTCVLGYTANFFYKFELNITSEVSNIHIDYEISIFRQIINSLLYNILYFMRGGTHIKLFAIHFQKDHVTMTYDSFAANEEHMCIWSKDLFKHLGNPYILDCSGIFQLLKEQNLSYEITPKQGKNKINIRLNKQEDMGRVIQFKKNI
jgi:hypothetical protein